MEKNLVKKTKNTWNARQPSRKILNCESTSHSQYNTYKLQQASENNGNAS